MKPVTVSLELSDYKLVQQKSKCSVYFFQRCKITEIDKGMPFEAVDITFTPDRLTRRPMIAMLKELVEAVWKHDEDSSNLCSIVYLFLFHLG